MQVEAIGTYLYSKFEGVCTIVYLEVIINYCIHWEIAMIEEWSKLYREWKVNGSD